MRAVKPYVKLTKSKIIISKVKEYRDKIKQHIKLSIKGYKKDAINEIKKATDIRNSKRIKINIGYSILYYVILAVCIIAITSTLFIHKLVYLTSNDQWFNRQHVYTIVLLTFIPSIVGFVLGGIIGSRKDHILVGAIIGSFGGTSLSILLMILMLLLLPTFVGNIILALGFAVGSFFLIRYINYGLQKKERVHQIIFYPIMISFLIGFPAILYFAINYFVINKYFPEYRSDSIAAITNLFTPSQHNQIITTMQSTVLPVTANNLNGKWNARIGESPAVIYLNPKGNTIYGDIYYQGIKEKLQGEIQGSNHVLLKGTSYKRLKGRGRFNLDTFYGNITSDIKSIQGNYTDAAGHTGYWFAAKAAKVYKYPNKKFPIINLTGEWKGNYIQKNVWGEDFRIKFQAELEQSDTQLTGTITEEKDSNTITANINGTVKGRIIEFVKRYNNVEQPPVVYKGTIGEGGFVSGTWKVGHLSGKWSIIKQ